MGEVIGGKWHRPYPPMPESVRTSNKRVCGVNQKVAPGLSNPLNMRLRRKHSGVKMGMGLVFDCCSYPTMNIPPYCIKYLNENGGCS